MSAIHRAECERLCREIGSEIARIADQFNEAHPDQPKIGFCFMMFTFGEGGFMTWLSNAERDTMIPAVRELLEKVGTSDGKDGAYKAT